MSTVPRLNFVLIQSPHCWLPHSCPHLWQKISHWELEAEASGSHEASTPSWKNPHKTDVSAYSYIFKKEGSRSYLCIQRFVDYGSKYFHQFRPKEGKQSDDSAAPPCMGASAVSAGSQLANKGSLDSVPWLFLQDCRVCGSQPAGKLLAAWETWTRPSLGFWVLASIISELRRTGASGRRRAGGHSRFSSTLSG